jgi:hypothetical protein
LSDAEVIVQLTGEETIVTDKKVESKIEDLPSSQIDLVSGGAGSGEIQSAYLRLCPEDTKNG